MNEDTPQPRRHRILSIALLVVGIVFALRFSRNQPVTYPNAEEHFKYGSTGGEREAGLPVAIWNILPDLFAGHLPGPGYASLGFIYETNRPFPVGVSQRNVQGVDRVSLDCAACHSGTVRDTPQSPRRVIAGMPANGLNLQAFERFLSACARDEHFNPARLVDEVARRNSDGWLNRQVFRNVTVNRDRQRLLTLAHRSGFMDREPDAGPGRVDMFNASKARLNFRMDKLPPEEWVGNGDMPAIWNQGKREGLSLHWDGNNNSLDERIRNAAFSTGATPPTLDRASVKRMKDFILTNTPPRWPYYIDLAETGRGEKLYADHCARCHGKDGKDFTGERVGQVTPIEKLKTDRHRLDSYSEELCANQGQLYAANPAERFTHFRKTAGYANQPLDGLWLRGPYLHNGSVPTLRELLEPAAKRRVEFYRGYDVIDRERVGFISDVPEEKGRAYFKFDTRLPGNSNAGHEGREYGTELSPADKDALVEYLKTF